MPEPTARPMTAAEERILDGAAKLMSRINTWLFRISSGRIGNKFLHGAPVMLLTTLGRKSGARRTLPLIYLEHGNSMAVVASKGGSARNPLWYLNLCANPDVEVQVGSETRPMHARDASPEEKATLWPGLTKIYPPYDHYQARTAREIPVVILSPR